MPLRTASGTSRVPGREHWWSSVVNDSGWIVMVGGVAGFTVQSVVFCCKCGVQRINLNSRGHHSWAIPHPVESLSLAPTQGQTALLRRLLSPPADAAATIAVCKQLHRLDPAALAHRISASLRRRLFCFLSLGGPDAAVGLLLIRAPALLERVRQLPS